MRAAFELCAKLLVAEYKWVGVYQQMIWDKTKRERER